MKYLVNDHKAINLANVVNIAVSNNWLMLTTIDGREQRFVYGTTDALSQLFDAVMVFITDTASVFDCGDFVKKIS